MAKKLTLAKLKEKVQKVFNKYIRLRDSGGGMFVCISCGEQKSTDVCDAGHFWAKQGYDGLRFDEDNCHAEDSGCNRFDESHLIGYAINLKQKIGKQAFEALNKRASDYKKNANFKWDRSDLEGMIKYYTQKIKEVQ